MTSSSQILTYLLDQYTNNAVHYALSGASDRKIVYHNLCNLLDFSGPFMLQLVGLLLKRAYGLELAIVMTSRRKQLEQEIARTDDPVIRMQLRELLTKKGQPQEKLIQRIEEALDSLLRQAIDRLPDQTPFVLIVIVFTIILFIIFMVLESGA